MIPCIWAKKQIRSSECCEINACSMEKYAREVKERRTVHTKLEGKTKAPPETLTLHLFIDDDRINIKVVLRAANLAQTIQL